MPDRVDKITLRADSITLHEYGVEVTSGPRLSAPRVTFPESLGVGQAVLSFPNLPAEPWQRR